MRFSGVRYDPRIVDIFVEIYQNFSTDKLGEGERIMSAEALQPGMVLSRNLLSGRGMVLLKRGHVLDANVIEKIINLENTSGDQLDVYVLLEEIVPGMPEE